MRGSVASKCVCVAIKKRIFSTRKWPDRQENVKISFAIYNLIGVCRRSFAETVKPTMEDDGGCWWVPASGAPKGRTRTRAPTRHRNAVRIGPILCPAGEIVAVGLRDVSSAFVPTCAPPSGPSPSPSVLTSHYPALFLSSLNLGRLSLRPAAFGRLI